MVYVVVKVKTIPPFVLGAHFQGQRMVAKKINTSHASTMLARGLNTTSKLSGRRLTHDRWLTKFTCIYW